MKYLKRNRINKHSIFAFYILSISQLFISTVMAEDITALTNNELVSKLTAKFSDSLLFSIAVPQGASGLIIKTGDHIPPGIPSCVGDEDPSSCQGDSILIVKYDSIPTLDDYDCIDDDNNGNGYRNGAECSFSEPQAGTYFVRMYAKSMFYSAHIKASYTEDQSVKTYSVNNLSVAQGQWIEYFLDIPAGTTQLKVEMSGESGDADLYVHNENSDFSCIPWLVGNDETCIINDPKSERWSIGIYGYSTASGVNLKATVTSYNNVELVINPVSDGWEGIGADNAKAIALSAADSLLENIPGVSLDPIILENSSDGPVVLFQRGSNNEYQVKINIGDTFWAQLVYQFSHEFMHILSNYGRTESDSNQWFEEALCEAASIHAVKRLSVVWETNPPLPHLQSFAPSMKDYYNNLIAEPHRYLQSGDSIANWYQREQVSLRNDAGQRDKNEVLGTKIYQFFEESPDRWRAVRYINMSNVNGQITLKQYLTDWQTHLPDDLKYVAETISDWFGYQ